MRRPILIAGGQVLLPDRRFADAAVVVDQGHIAHTGPVPAGFDGEIVDVGGGLVVPGLIETHVHGALAHDVMDATAAALAAIGRHLAGHGVTSWLPTTVACPGPTLDRILQAVEAAMDGAEGGARVLGAHLESNFLAAKYKGAQPAEWLREPADAELRAVIAARRTAIRVVTLAPELPGALDLVRELVAMGVVVSIGHSDATYDQALAAVEAGARRVTHLCNAQRPFHHREPGVVGAGLVCDALWSEIIPDLVHVHPAGLQIARRCKGADKLVLVSDAVRGSGLPPGRYELGGQVTLLDGESSRLADGTIAGGVIALDRAVANMVAAGGASPAEAFWMASAAPAASLGLTDRGELAPGRLADLAVFGPDFTCRGTMIGGAWVHGAWAPAPTEVAP